MSKHGINVSTIETLGPLLEKEGFNVIMSSSKNNPIITIEFSDLQSAIKKINK